MRDYISTVFNLIVGLVDANKIVLLALVGLGVIFVWQVINLMTNFNSRLARKCRRISKFLSTKGLSADNYNKFISLIAKMPQEFIRGYKAFEHASYGLPSDYIKRFDSVDVEGNGGMFNHGKSLLKSFIYGWMVILALLSLALLGAEASLTGFALADALLVPVLFGILAKVMYYIFIAIRQQQYRVAVDEFNEMLDIMNDKIENNDNVPGPDILSEVEPFAMGTITTSPTLHETSKTELEPNNVNESDLDENLDYAYPIAQEGSVQEDFQEPPYNTEPLDEVQSDFVEAPKEQTLQESSEEQGEQLPQDTFTEEDLKLEPHIEEPIQEKVFEEPYSIDQTQEYIADQDEPADSLAKVYGPKERVEDITEPQNIITNQDMQSNEQNIEKSEEITAMEEQKRGRGRPKKVAESELVITNDKQFEEALERAEKLMRKSEEALSSSQAKRVEKALKDLVDAMTKYKEDK